MVLSKVSISTCRRKKERMLRPRTARGSLGATGCSRSVGVVKQPRRGRVREQRPGTTLPVELCAPGRGGCREGLTCGRTGPQRPRWRVSEVSVRLGVSERGVGSILGTNPGMTCQVRPTFRAPRKDGLAPRRGGSTCHGDYNPEERRPSHSPAALGALETRCCELALPAPAWSPGRSSQPHSRQYPYLSILQKGTSSLAEEHRLSE